MTSNDLEKFDKMKTAGNLAARTLDLITQYIKPGITTSDIDKLGYEFIKDHGGHSAPLFYRGFNKSLCTSLNNVVCHGIPGNKILNEGDILNVDVTAIVDLSRNNYGGISNKTTYNFSTGGTGASNPLDDKDVVASIEAQTEAPKKVLQHVTTPVFNRLNWIRGYETDDNLNAQSIKFNIANPKIDKITITLSKYSFFLY